MGPASVVPRIVDAPAGVIMLTLFAAELVVYTLPAESTATEFGPAPVVPNTDDARIPEGAGAATAAAAPPTSAHERRMVSVALRLPIGTRLFIMLLDFRLGSGDGTTMWPDVRTLIKKGGVR